MFEAYERLKPFFAYGYVSSATLKIWRILVFLRLIITLFRSSRRVGMPDDFELPDFYRMVELVLSVSVV